MPCFYPLKAYPSPGGGRISFSRPPGHSGREQHIACGQCIGCRADRSIEWAARISHECLSWSANWFITLTYEDDCLPADLSIDKREVILFFKRLREAAAARGLLEGSGVRRFYNGEYGTRTQRAHYHAIIFGVRLPDLKFWKNNDRGERMWTSDFLAEVWHKGRVVVGSVTPASAAYCAGYCLRDSGAKHLPYGFIDPDTGELCERTPPFIGMSRRPGIGRAYVERYGGQLAAGDFVIIDGRKVPSPKYYRRVLESLNPHLAEQLATAREAAAHTPRAKRERRPDRLKARETVARAKRALGKSASGLVV